MPEVVENWVSQLLGEILLAMIFAVGSAVAVAVVECAEGFEGEH